jgi:hypothetical protein
LNKCTDQSRASGISCCRLCLHHALIVCWSAISGASSVGTCILCGPGSYSNASGAGPPSLSPSTLTPNLTHSPSLTHSPHTFAHSRSLTLALSNCLSVCLSVHLCLSPFCRPVILCNTFVTDSHLLLSIYVSDVLSLAHYFILDFARFLPCSVSLSLNQTPPPPSPPSLRLSPSRSLLLSLNLSFSSLKVDPARINAPTNLEHPASRAADSVLATL